MIPAARFFQIKEYPESRISCGLVTTYILPQQRGRMDLKRVLDRFSE